MKIADCRIKNRKSQIFNRKLLSGL